MDRRYDKNVALPNSFRNYAKIVLPLPCCRAAFSVVSKMVLDVAAKKPYLESTLLPHFTQTKGAKMTTLALQTLSYVTILPALAFIALAFWVKA